MKQIACPCCQCTDLESFFTIRNAPVQSVATIHSYEDAVSIPRHDIVLTFCNHCGFIFNSEFDAEWDYYTQGYEDQQSFSPTFVKFITSLTQRFINKYGIRNKRVVEIGCGKGDFIYLICRLGQNQGVGIDPAWVPGRVEGQSAIRFIPEFYSQEHGQIKADCIICRHTMEHIHCVGEFLRIIRDSCAGSRPILFFEVPSVLRILKDQAFWDIFGEHCNYFSPASLARLFRRYQFEVIDLFLEYDEQYLFIEARPLDRSLQKTQPLEESVNALKSLSRLFAKHVEEKLEEWRTCLLQLKKAQKKVVLWGGGSKAVGFLTQFDEIGVIDQVVDINPHLLGNFIPGFGIQYVGPEFLENYRPDVVIVMNSIYIKEVQFELKQRDLFPQVIGL